MHLFKFFSSTHVSIIRNFSYSVNTYHDIFLYFHKEIFHKNSLFSLKTVNFFHFSRYILLLQNIRG